jgi:hypothetical protein
VENRMGSERAAEKREEKKLKLISMEENLSTT